MRIKKLAGDKTVIARLPYDLWKTLKKHSADEEKSMNYIINDSLSTHFNKKKKMLTDSDKMIK